MRPVLSEYLPILILAALAFVFAVASLGASSALRPNRPNPVKLSPYGESFTGFGRFGRRADEAPSEATANTNARAARIRIGRYSLSTGRIQLPCSQDAFASRSNR